MEYHLPGASGAYPRSNIHHQTGRGSLARWPSQASRAWLGGSPSSRCARRALLPFSLQNSKFKIWQRMRPNFEFRILRRRISIGRSVTSRRRRRGARATRCCYFPCKFWILNFAASGLNRSGRSPSRRRVAVVASGLNRRVSIVGSQSSVAVVVFSRKNQNSKFGRGCCQILNFDFCGVGSQSSSSHRRRGVASRRNVSKHVFTYTHFGFDICNRKLLTLKHHSSIAPSLQNLYFIYFLKMFMSKKGHFRTDVQNQFLPVL